LLLIVPIFNLSAQEKDIALHENKFVTIYSKLSSFIQNDYDSVSFYSDKFEKEFSNFIENNQTTLNYPFKKLTDGNFCWIRTSPDKNFRVYSWDTWMGGTMHIFKTIYQWRSNGRVHTEIPVYEEGDAGRFCSRIFNVDIGRKTYYLVVDNAIFSTKDALQSISVYTVANNKLNDTIKLFKTKTQKLNSIDVEFDFFSVADRPERPLELITYDEKQKIVYVPVVGEAGKVTKKNIMYQLKGGYFEFIGITTGKRK